MWTRLLELLDRTADVGVLVVGDYMLDRYLYGDAERISPEAPVPVLRVVRQEDGLGGAASVAADVAAIGSRPFCVGIIGPDDDGRRMTELLETAGADPAGLLAVPGRPTTRKTRLVGLAQHKHRQQLIRIDDESTAPLDPPHVEQLLASVARGLPRCQVVCIEDYNKGVITAELCRRIVELARAAGVPVAVDPASVADYSRYAGATIITPNRTETEKVTGLHLRNVDAVRDAAPAIHAACYTEHVCVTLDAEGAALIGPDGSCQHVPTRTRDVYDVTGAGDEVLAALSVGLALGAELQEAVALANVAGGLEVEKFGCVPVTRDEIAGEILAEHHRELGKVRALDALLPELARRRQRGETIAFTNGCFDLLHRGHVENFRFCKTQADLLVVGVNSDASVRRLAKGADRPIVGEEDRAVVLAALADVDYVVVFDEDTPQSLIEAVRPDVLIKGREYDGRLVVGQEFVERHGGRVVLAPMIEGTSTTGLVERIRGNDPSAAQATTP